MMDLNTISINAIIADDEVLARNVIKNYLAAFPQIKILAECENGLVALNKINALKPDLLFLDIQMPELDGFAVLSELKNPPLIIFTTAFNQYAVKAFENNAIDYLLKPFDQQRFSMAIRKILSQNATPPFWDNKIIALQATLDQLIDPDKKFITRLLIKETEGYSFLPVENIMWFEAYSDYVKIHTSEKMYLKNISLNELETKLNPRIFARIHRSTIVNISFIREMKPYFNGEYHLILINDDKLKLSRSYKDKLHSIMHGSI